MLSTQWGLAYQIGPFMHSIYSPQQPVYYCIQGYLYRALKCFPAWRVIITSLTTIKFPGLLLREKDAKKMLIYVVKLTFQNVVNIRLFRRHTQLKGIVHQFWIYKKNFRVSTKTAFFIEVHLDKTTLTRNDWENRVLKVSPSEYCYIYYIYKTDRLWAPFFSII